jgi:PEP-CTERM motif
MRCLRLSITGLVTLILLATAWAQADAVLIPFTDEAAFLGATGASSATGPLPNVGRILTGTKTVGSVTFSIIPPSEALFIGGRDVSRLLPTEIWTELIPGNAIAVSGVENLSARFATPVFSAGFQFAEPSAPLPAPKGCDTSPCVDSTFSVLLLSGASSVGARSFNAPDDTLAFFGLWSSSPFDQLVILDATATADDEYFGQFFSGTTPVPEPTALVLLGSGVVGLVGVAWRRRRQ